MRLLGRRHRVLSRTMAALHPLLTHPRNPVRRPEPRPVDRVPVPDHRRNQPPAAVDATPSSDRFPAPVRPPIQRHREAPYGRCAWCGHPLIGDDDADCPACRHLDEATT